MKMRRIIGFAFCFFTFLSCWSTVMALLSPKGVNYEVQALMGIKASLEDPHGVLENWDGDSVDPCSWTMVTCSAEGLVIGLGTPSQNLSGTLSQSIGNLTNLQIILLQNNNITGPIPPKLGQLSNLQTLDLSSNQFSGEIPSSLGLLENLQYMRLNNNSLIGKIPKELANMSHLTLLDLSFNNLSKPLPRLAAKSFNVLGNPMICPIETAPECSGMTLIPMSMALNTSQDVVPSRTLKSHKLVIACGSSIVSISLLILGIGLFLWSRKRNKNHMQFDKKDDHNEKVSLGNLRRFEFRELQVATNNFSSKNLLGKGGFGHVYKGSFHYNDTKNNSVSSSFSSPFQTVIARRPLGAKLLSESPFQTNSCLHLRFRPPSPLQQRSN